MRATVPGGMLPRLVATDLDGTLLGRDGHVSARTAAALRAARAAGVLVVPVTARMPIGLQQLREEAGLDDGAPHDWALCGNGALAVRLSTGEVRFALHVEPEAQREIARALLALRPDAVFASVRDAGWTFVAEAGYASLASFGDHKRDPAAMVPQPREAVLAEPSIKLVARGVGWDLAEVVDALRALAIPGVAVTRSGAPFVEIMADGVSKARGLELLCASLGIDRADVIAFGDALNDVEMLAWAGHGVAVADAEAAALAAADEVTASNADDGVALVLERVLGEAPVTPR